MGDEVVQRIALALQHSLLPDAEARTAAEAALRELERSPQPYLVSLFRVVVDAQVTVDGAVRQAGAIALKNLVVRRWDGCVREPELAEEEKAIVRANLLEGLIHAPPMVRTQLGLIVRSVAYSDFPHAWPGLLEGIAHNLTQGEARMYGALYAERMLVKKYEYKSRADREPLLAIVACTYPTLIQIFAALAEHEHPQAYEMQRLICKIFWSSMQCALPDELAKPWESPMLSQWLSLLVQLLEKPIPLALQPADEDSFRDNQPSKCKKWAAHILYRMLQRYGNPKYARDEPQKQLARYLLSNYAVRCLEAAMGTLTLKEQGTLCSPRVETLCFNFVAEALCHPSLYKTIRPQLETLLVRVIFPQLCITQSELALWSDDPTEYVRKELDVLEEFYSPKVAATNLLADLVRKRARDCMHPFLLFCTHTLNAAAVALPGGPASAVLPRDFATLAKKDGVLLALGELTAVLRKKMGDSDFGAQIEPIVRAHVAPELTSAVGFMRARACSVYSRLYRSLRFADEAHFVHSSGALVACLRDPELPVRVQAAMALQHLIVMEQARPLLRERVPELIELLFGLMSDIGHEEVVSALDALIEKFADEMEPYALRVVSTLVEAFGRMYAEGDDDEDAMLAAMSVMRTIATMLEAVSAQPDVFPPLQALLLPLVCKLIDSDASEFLEDTLEVLSYLTFCSPTISNEALGLLPIMVEAFSDWAVEFSNQMLVPIDNIITRAKDLFLASTDTKGTPYVALVLSMPAHVLGVKADGTVAAEGGARDRLMLPETECHGAVKLLQVLLHNCAGQIDAYLPSIVRMAVHGLRNAETASMRTLLLDAIASALHYSPPLALAALEELGSTANVLQGWTQHVAEQNQRMRVHDVKCMVLGFSALLSGPPADLPAAAQAALVQCVRACVALLLRRRALDEEAARRCAAGGEEEDDEIDDESDEDDEAEEGKEGAISLQSKPTEVSKALRAGALTGDELSALVSELGDYDDLDDDEEYASPLDAVDELQTFVGALERACALEPRLRALMEAEMSEAEQQQLRAVAARY